MVTRDVVNAVSSHSAGKDSKGECFREYLDPKEIEDWMARPVECMRNKKCIHNL
jgi:hypothetical protein